MSFRFGKLRRFRFNLPQRIAAGMLLIFLAQAFWLTSRQTLTERDYQYARCGREMWERPSPLAGYYTSCGNIHDGILAYRVAGLPLTLNFAYERFADNFRKPEDKVVQTFDDQISSWEMRHQLTHVLLLIRLPFIAAGLLLGGSLWWVTRRLFGNLGGYTALALYIFSPAVLRASVSPNPEILTALGFFGGLYTCIGVAHAMQGPRRKWRPRIILLTVCFAVAAASHIASLLLLLGAGFVFMLWIAEGRRSQIVPVLLVVAVGAFILLFACYGFSPDAFSYLFRSDAAQLGLSLQPAKRFFPTPGNAGIVVATASALLLYFGLRKTLYFGNTTPFLTAILLFSVITAGVPGNPILWGVPFLLAFIAGVFADAYDSPRRRLAIAAAGAIVALQAVVCILSLPGLI
ncbi:glycosyltransferase family 39 protein [Acidicapsa dinghuensis]|uniref:Glycosyltransferase family 39 protein n=1 Tax=Acidicapsa dinghuensis TaxID=2218256 RepID=A0ABW1EHE7_9BACT|nr:glycosyltransferase family 39 protein [Acidicapsa dinghuensis]